MSVEAQEAKKPTLESERPKAEGGAEMPELTPEKISAQGTEAAQEADAAVNEAGTRAADLTSMAEKRGGTLTAEDSKESGELVAEASKEAGQLKVAVQDVVSSSSAEESKNEVARQLAEQDAEDKVAKNSEYQAQIAADLAEQSAEDVASEKAEESAWKDKIDAAKADIAAAEVAVPAAADTEIKYSGVKGVRVSKEMREQVKAMRATVEASRAEMVKAEAAVRQFEGTIGIGLLGGKKMEKAAAEMALDAARQKYESTRGEYVGENATRLMKERLAAEDARAEKVKDEKSELMQKATDAWRYLGDKNLGSALGWNPTSKIGQMVAKGVSLRMLAGAGFVGAGAAIGAGAAGAMGAELARRSLAAGLATFGKFDMVRHGRDTELQAFKAEQAPTMGTDEVIRRMEGMEAKARLAGQELGDDAQYAVLRRELRDRMSKETTHADDFKGPDGKPMTMEQLAAVADKGIAEAVLKRRSQDKKALAAGLGMGALAASGVLGRAFKVAGGFVAETDLGQWVSDGAGKAFASAKELIGAQGASADVLPEAPGETETDTDIPKMKAVESGPLPDDLKFNLAPENSAGMETSGSGGSALESPVGAAEAAPAAEAVPTAEAAPVGTGADVIQRGDGYVKVFARQMEANPAKFGYDASKHGEDIHKWAMKEGNAIAKAQGLMDKRIGFNPDKPMKITLNPDRTVIASGKVDMSSANADVAAKTANLAEETKAVVGGGLKAEKMSGLAAVTETPNPVASDTIAEAAGQAPAAGELPAGGAQAEVDASQEIAGGAKRTVGEGLGGDNLKSLDEVTDTPNPNAGEILHDVAPDATPEAHVPAEAPVEAAPAPVEAVGGTETNPAKIMEVKIGPDGSRDLNMRWDKFHFDEKLSPSEKADIIKYMDNEYKIAFEQQELVKQAEAKYGDQPWFKSFKAEANYEINRDVVRLNQSLKIATGEVQGKLSVSVSGNMDPHYLAKWQLSMVGGFNRYPNMDLD